MRFHKISSCINEYFFVNVSMNTQVHPIMISKWLLCCIVCKPYSPVFLSILVATIRTLHQTNVASGRWWNHETSSSSTSGQSGDENHQLESRVTLQLTQFLRLSAPWVLLPGFKMQLEMFHGIMILSFEACGLSKSNVSNHQKEQSMKLLDNNPSTQTVCVVCLTKPKPEFHFKIIVVINICSPFKNP